MAQFNPDLLLKDELSYEALLRGLPHANVAVAELRRSIRECGFDTVSYTHLVRVSLILPISFILINSHQNSSLHAQQKVVIVEHVCKPNVRSDEVRSFKTQSNSHLNNTNVLCITFTTIVILLQC